MLAREPELLQIGLDDDVELEGGDAILVGYDVRRHDAADRHELRRAVDCRAPPGVALLQFPQLTRRFIVNQVQSQAAPTLEKRLHAGPVVVTGDLDQDPLGPLLAPNDRLGNAELVDPRSKDGHRQVDRILEFLPGRLPAQAGREAFTVRLHHHAHAAGQVEAEADDPALEVLERE